MNKNDVVAVVVLRPVAWSLFYNYNRIICE